MIKAIKKMALYGFAIVGALLIASFILHAVGAFDVGGKVDDRSALFSLTSGEVKKYSKELNNQYDMTQIDNEGVNIKTISCQIDYLSQKYPASANRIYAALQSSNDLQLVHRMLFATSTADTNLSIGYTDCLHKKDNTSLDTVNPDAYAWMQSDEWRVLKTALIKDQEAITKVAKQLNMSPRIFLGPVIGEQLRFYTSARATFKSYLMPTNSFIYLSSFSYGIAGLKPETCEKIESHLKDPSSVWYPGPKYEHMLDYDASITDIPAERMRRITDRKDHSWAYLYAGLYLKQFEAQWQKSNIEIGNRPDILATLYNLGHNRSIPKPNPAAGGAPITINGVTYTFGGLAYDFYWSGELQDLFPY